MVGRAAAKTVDCLLALPRYCMAGRSCRRRGRLVMHTCMQEEEGEGKGQKKQEAKSRV